MGKRICPAAPGLIPSVPKWGKILDIVEVNHWRCLEESEKGLEIADRTHLELASGKLKQQKSKLN